MSREKEGSIVHRKSEDYTVGEGLSDGRRDYGKIVSIAKYPDGKRQLMYFLVVDDDGYFSMITGVVGAVCKPWVAYHVPCEVMKRFLFDAFVGVDLPEDDSGCDARIPVEKLPEWKFRHKTGVKRKQVEKD